MLKILFIWLCPVRTKVRLKIAEVETKYLNIVFIFQQRKKTVMCKWVLGKVSAHSSSVQQRFHKNLPNSQFMKRYQKIVIFKIFVDFCFHLSGKYFVLKKTAKF